MEHIETQILPGFVSRFFNLEGPIADSSPRPDPLNTNYETQWAYSSCDWSCGQIGQQLRCLVISNRYLQVPDS